MSPSTPRTPLRGAYPFCALKELQGRFAALKCHSHAASRRLSDPLRHPSRSLSVDMLNFNIVC